MNLDLHDPVTAIANRIENDDRFDEVLSLFLVNLTDSAFADIREEIREGDHDNHNAALIELGGYSEVVRRNWGRALNATFSDPGVENYSYGGTSVRDHLGHRKDQLVESARSRTQTRVVNEL